VTLRFLPPSSNGGYRVNRYDIKTYPTERVYNCTSTNCHIGGLAAGTLYFFQVAAVTKVGRGAYSYPSKTVTPTGSVTLTFNANGGSGTMASETGPYDTTANLTPNTFTYLGYTFAGWNTRANGSGTAFTNGELVKFIGGATFYAQWTVATAPSTTGTITFNANGGIGTMALETETLNVSAALTTNVFTRTGYTFSDWNTTASDTGTSFTNSEVVQFSASIMLYAQWTAVPTATLSLSPNSLTSAGGTVILTYSSENATTCTLTSSPLIWASATEPVDCNGTYQDNVASTTSSREWTFTFTASNTSGQSTTSTQTFVESAASTTPQFTNSSVNWSGYVVPSSSALVTDVEGEWTVPTMNCSDTANGDTSIWVGIGGEQWNATTSSGVLLQTGVQADCVDGVQQNYGWWEEYPAIPNVEEEFNDFPVSAGDEIEASVFQESDGAWETIVSDLTTGLSGILITGEAWGVQETGATSFVNQGTATGLNYSGGYTAEWIMEDPGITNETGAVRPFANFGSVTFSNMRSSFSSWSLTPTEEWGIVQDGATLAAPTSSTTDGFTVTYMGP
jgi:uncharacterized repeat protein (TIGR02543 family)